MSQNNDEFYVGYHDTAPPATAAFVKKIIVVLLLAAAALSFVLVSMQSVFYPSFFEFGMAKSFEGTIVENPYPVLVMQRPGQKNEGSAGLSRLPLVAFGKFGAAVRVAGLDGQQVRLQGSLIYRDGETMIEIADDPIKKILDEINRPLLNIAVSNTDHSKGRLTAIGEIVDSKCFLGVMNPGNLKTHKACAIRCISGGIPPIFVVKTADGQAKYFLLISPEGKAVNQDVLPMVAEPVKISGEVEQQGDLFFLKAHPALFELL